MEKKLSGDIIHIKYLSLTDIMCLLFLFFRVCQRNFRRSNYPFCPLLFVYSADFLPTLNIATVAQTEAFQSNVLVSISIVIFSGLCFTIK